MSAKAVTVSEMAAMVDLGRARFYQLVGTAFPMPRYDVATKRPFFDEELQRICLEVRQGNRGVDGRPILFYRRRKSSGATKRSESGRRRFRAVSAHAELMAGLKQLGLPGVTERIIERELQVQFPNGTNGVPPAELLRRLFLELWQQSQSTNRIASQDISVG